VFALTWALGVVVHRIAHISLAVICLAIGSAAFSYLVWEYHRAWRLHPSSAGSKARLRLRSWSGINVDGLTVRPEYITAALTLLLCVLGIVIYFKASSRTPPPVPESSPTLPFRETTPLQ
ncbi:MAG TPA: hypothetical protein VEK31_02290, partial [Xanthobacteraceae bacterium]|nr:hypothetical protein [Xanthobacteraceae bacterium]